MRRLSLDETYAVRAMGYTTPCWIWTAGTSAGRPIFRQRNAYRAVWEAIREETLDPAYVLLRRCAERLCVNPDHFEHRPRKLGLPRRPRTFEERKGWNLRRYGITLAEYQEMQEQQGGVCAVCREDSRDKLGRSLHVDHCHETGAVRGLLCTRCNNAIGHARESADRLRDLAAYLEGSLTFPSQR